MLAQIIGTMFPRIKISYFGELEVLKTCSIVVDKVMLLPPLFKNKSGVGVHFVLIV